MEKITIDEQFITLGQLLKSESIIQSGGMAKWFLSEHEVYVDGELETRRGRKLYHNTIISIPSESLEYQIISSSL